MLPFPGPDPVAPGSVGSNSVVTGNRGRVRRFSRFAAVVPAFAVLGVLLAACSSGSHAASGSSTSTTAGSGSASFQSYLTCLKNHGVSLPTGGRPGGTPGSFTPGSTRPTIPASERSAYEKAEQACASLRPSFPGGGSNPGASTEFAAYRNCLKLHGVTLPSGSGGFFGGGTGSSSTTPTTESSKVKAAEAACASLRPKGGFGNRPPSSTTTTTS
jgi:hypothetical protein